MQPKTIAHGLVSLCFVIALLIANGSYGAFIDTLQVVSFGTNSVMRSPVRVYPGDVPGYMLTRI